jgi:MFS family permease
MRSWLDGSRRLWVLLVGQALSEMGDQLYLLALPWIVYNLTQSAQAMATIGALEVLSRVISGIIAGVFVDRFSYRTIMIWSILVQVICSGAIPILAMTEQLNLWYVYVLAFFLASAAVWYLTAFQTMLPQIVSLSDLQAANARANTVAMLVRLVGPSLASLVIAYYSAYTSLLVNAVSFLPLVFVLLILPLPHVATGQWRTFRAFFKDMGEGIQYTFANVPVRTITLMTMIANIGITAVVAILVFYLRDRLRLSGPEVGAIFTAGAIGSIVGSVFFVRFMRWFTEGQGMIIGTLMLAVGLALLAFPTTWYGFAASYLVATLGTAIASILSISIRQVHTPAALQGRVTGAGITLTRLPSPLVMALAGWAVSHIDPRFIFGVGGAIVATSVLLAYHGLLKRSPQDERAVPLI